MNNQNAKIMIIPGNGCQPILKCNWYGWLSENLKKSLPSYEVICETMPDSDLAREQFWIPFVKQKLGDDQNQKKYVIGHSSGAVAIMRLLEHFQVTGAILVSGCVSDLNQESERISGYYPQQPNSNELRPWQFDQMRKNSKWIIHIGSQDDQFIPISEMREIKDQLQLSQDDYFEFDKNQKLGHFMIKKFPQLLEIFLNKIQKEQQ